MAPHSLHVSSKKLQQCHQGDMMAKGDVCRVGGSNSQGVTGETGIVNITICFNILVQK